MDYQFFENSGQQVEKHKKIIQKNFKVISLQIIIKCNLKLVDYLDVTLNLNDGVYRFFHKPIYKKTYNHVEHAQPTKIIKKIPGSNEKNIILSIFDKRDI